MRLPRAAAGRLVLLKEGQVNTLDETSRHTGTLGTNYTIVQIAESRVLPVSM